MRKERRPELPSGWLVNSHQTMARQPRRTSMDCFVQKLQTMGDTQARSRRRYSLTVWEKMGKNSGRVSDIRHCQLTSVTGGEDTGAGFQECKAPDDRVASSKSNGVWEGREQNGRSGKLGPVDTDSYASQDSLKYQMIFFKDGKETSPWHTIDLHVSEKDTLNCICKTPARGWIRYEIAQNEPFNPLRIMNGRPGEPARYANNCLWNIGVLPQTWADPEFLGAHSSVLKKYQFDDRPVEVVEIGEVVAKRTGDVYAVKPLAAFLVLEGGVSLSWKVVAIAVDDPLSDLLHNVADLNTLLPSTLCAIRDWLSVRLCTETGSAKTLFPVGDEPFDVSEAVNAITRAHSAWQSKIAHGPLASAPLPPGHAPPGTSSWERVWTTYTDAKWTAEVDSLQAAMLSSPVLCDSVGVELASADAYGCGEIHLSSGGDIVNQWKGPGREATCDSDLSSRRSGSFRSSGSSSSSSFSSCSTALSSRQCHAAGINSLRPVSGRHEPKSRGRCPVSPSSTQLPDPGASTKSRDASLKNKRLSLFGLGNVLGFGKTASGKARVASAIPMSV